MMGVGGLRTVDELNGISWQVLELITPEKQNLCTLRSFVNTIHTLGGIKKRIHYFSTRATTKLRSGGLVATIISIFVRGNRFRSELPQYSNWVTVNLDGSTSDTGSILNAALYGLNKIYRYGVPYKKAGVFCWKYTQKTKHQEVCSQKETLNVESSCILWTDQTTSPARVLSATVWDHNHALVTWARKCCPIGSPHIGENYWCRSRYKGSGWSYILFWEMPTE